MGRSVARTVIALARSGTGKTHIARAWTYLACQKGLSVGLSPPPALVIELMEARGRTQTAAAQKQMVSHKLLIITSWACAAQQKPALNSCSELISQRL